MRAVVRLGSRTFGSCMQPADGVERFKGSSLAFACQARGKGLEPRTELVQGRGQGLDALLGVVGPLALGRGLIARFGQAVGESQSGHDDETLVADLAERLAHLADLLIDRAGQRLEARFFPL